MITTIDAAGRLVIPKAIRDRLGLRGGEKLEVEEWDGEITVARPKRRVRLVRRENGLLSASPDSDMPGLGPDEVRELLERTRR
jgi:AbrB family looped-hinge helix DNA binding protein